MNNLYIFYVIFVVNFKKEISRSIFAPCVTTFTPRKWAILTVVLNQEQLLKTSRMIGYVLFAEWGKKTLKSIMNSDERVSD